MRRNSFAMMVVLAALLPRIAIANLTASQVDAMRAADIVILGEVHDNSEHHLGQARLIAQIGPRAVVFEMLSAEQAEQVNADTRRDLPALAEQIGWSTSGWPSFAIYQPVFEALGDAIVIGAALPRARVRAAFDQGAAAVFDGDAARFGLNAPLPAAQQDARAALQFAAHCEAMSLSLMEGMVEAQRLRDAAFAASALAALGTHGAPVVVITGNGHARKDWAIPALIARAAPDVTVYAVGFVETPVAPTDPRFDAAIITDAAPRSDPCATFND